ncbi:MAG: hypothetical protein AAB367_03015 [Patescibacteria group bacterium]
MSFEKETPPESENSSENIELPGPRLRGIFRSLKLLEKADFGEGEVSWRELWQQVKPFENGVEFSDNIREVVRQWVAQKIPTLRESVKSLEDIPDDALVDALGQNWFESLDDEERGFEVSGQRREVLLTVMAGVVSRIEASMTKSIIKHASPEDLEKLGLTENLRDLASDVLEASIKANPLWVRFRAFSLLTPKPPANEETGIKATGVKMFVPGDPNPHTIAELFPHETQAIAQRFAGIVERGGPWLEHPGADAFQKYVEGLLAFYAEKDPDVAEGRLQGLEKLYLDVIASGFPILINSGRFGMYKEPYLDPELKISLVTPDAKNELSFFEQAKKAMAESFDDLNLGEFQKALQERPVASGVVVGSFGVNTVFSAVAQERPAIFLFYDRQVQAYDRKFPALMELAGDSEVLFEGMNEEERRETMERMSRMLTMLHEYGHDVFPHKTDESVLTPAYERFDGHLATVIDEIKAENYYRALVPSIIERGGLEGTKEQWATAMVMSSLQVAGEQPNGSEYYYAATYSLNRLFQEGVVTFSEGQVHIHDFERLYQINKENAEALSRIHTDENMTKRKTQTWIRENCKASPEVTEVVSSIKKLLKGKEN